MGLGSIAKSVGKVVSTATDLWKESGLGTVLDSVQPYLQGGLSYYGQQQTNAANATEAEKNRQFQAQMRATQYQTTVDDLIKAGLNPMLAYQNGGAGNLSGAVSAPYQNAMGQGVSSALQARANVAEVHNLEQQNKNLQEQVKLIPAQIAQATESANYLHNQSATEIYRALREKQGIQLDRERFDFEKSMGAVLAALQHAQARNYDANSAYTSLQNYHDSLMTDAYESDAAIRRSDPGKVARRAGTLLEDILPFRRNSRTSSSRRR